MRLGSLIVMFVLVQWSVGLQAQNVGKSDASLDLPYSNARCYIRPSQEVWNEVRVLLRQLGIKAGLSRPLLKLQ